MHPPAVVRPGNTQHPERLHHVVTRGPLRDVASSLSVPTAPSNHNNYDTFFGPQSSSQPHHSTICNSRSPRCSCRSAAPRSPQPSIVADYQQQPPAIPTTTYHHLTTQGCSGRHDDGDYDNNTYSILLVLFDSPCKKNFPARSPFWASRYTRGRVIVTTNQTDSGTLRHHPNPSAPTSHRCDIRLSGYCV
jgi:hypothetical protein